MPSRPFNPAIQALLGVLSVGLPIIAVLVAAQFVLPAGLPWIWRQMLLAAFGIGAVACAEAVGWSNSAEPLIARLGFRLAPRRVVVTALVTSVPMWLFLPLLASLRGQSVPPQADWPLILAGVILVNGATEEVLHRAFIFGHARTHMSFWRAAAFSAAIFGGQHLYLLVTAGTVAGLASVLLAVLLAIPLARLFESGERSIIGPMIAHTSSNAPYLIFAGDQSGPVLLAHMGIVLLSIWSSFLVLGFKQ